MFSLKKRVRITTPTHGLTVPVQSDQQSYNMQNPKNFLQEWRVVCAFLSIFSVFALNLMFFSSHAYALSANVEGCPASGSHCYAVVDWPNSVNGAMTTINIRAIAAGNGFVNHALWIDDANTHGAEQCYITQGDPSTNGVCQVEAGYTSSNDPNDPKGEYWYWTDIRPGGQGYSFHPGGILQPGDYGHSVRVYIFAAQHNPTHLGFCPYAANEWCVDISGYQTSMIGVSGNGNTQSMHVTDYNEGIEYSNGDGSANSPNASFAYNLWQSTSNDSLNYQTNNGVTTGNFSPDYPAKGCWSPPATQSSTGGAWLTYLDGSSGGSGC